MDAATVSGKTWEARAQALQNAADLYRPVVTAGFLIADDERGVVVTLMYNDLADDVGHAVMIPRGMVLRVTQLRPGRGFKRDVA